MNNLYYTRKNLMKKYSGCGNTFMICRYQKEYDNKDFAKKISLDTDGFLMVKENPLTMIIYNQDGSIAKMCVNGIRCFIKYCYDEKIITSLENTVQTLSGNIYTKIINLNPFLVYVRMNEPVYTYIDNRQHLNESLHLNHHFYQISLINTGVWHGVIIPHNFQEALSDAKDIRNLPNYVDYLNIDLVQIKDNKIYLKTYERGVGFTKACGTGASATFHILKKLQLIDTNKILINVDGGQIEAGIDENGSYILGEATYLE